MRFFLKSLSPCRHPVALAMALAGLCASPHAAPLTDLYRAALAADPAVASAQAQWQAAEQRVVQARAAFGPSANITAGATDTRYREAPALNLRPFHSRQVNLQVTQPLFRSALLPALDAALAQLDQAAGLLAQAQADTGARLMEAAFDVMKARDTLVLARAQGLAVDEQLRLAQGRFRAGTAAITDAREAEARAGTAAAQVATAQVDLQLRSQVLAELTGLPLPPDLLDLSLRADRLPDLAQASLPTLLADALASSPQVQQAQFAVQVAEAEVNKAWQGHAPTADLTLTYSKSSDTGTVTSLFPRSGESTAVGINVTVPLFASGATQSRVKETVALRQKALSDLDTARRNLTLNLRQAFANALSAMAQVEGLQTAQRAQEQVVHGNRRSYEVGLKVMAEVLDAQARLFEVRRDLARARYEAWLAKVKLQALAGRLGEADVALLDGLLVPAQTGPGSTSNQGRAP